LLVSLPAPLPENHAYRGIEWLGIQALFSHWLHNQECATDG
jgi:hypothetical protein